MSSNKMLNGMCCQICSIITIIQVHIIVYLPSVSHTKSWENSSKRILARANMLLQMWSCRLLCRALTVHGTYNRASYCRHGCHDPRHHTDRKTKGMGIMLSYIHISVLLVKLPLKWMLLNITDGKSTGRSCNRLAPSGSKSVPEPMLIQFRVMILAAKRH